MSDSTRYITNSNDLGNIADAIRQRGATSALLIYPTGFVSAINALPEPKIETSLSVTENGTYTPASGQTYNSVIVDVPTGGNSTDPYPVRNDGNGHIWVVIDDLANANVSIRVYSSSGSNSGAGYPYIDWGDGSEVTYITSSNRAALTHTYSAVGVYDISACHGSQSGYAYFGAAPIFNTTSTSATKLASADISILRRYRAIEIPHADNGAKSSLLANALCNAFWIEKITFPSGFDGSSSSQRLNIRGLAGSGTINQYATNREFGAYSLREINFNGSATYTYSGQFQHSAITTLDLSNEKGNVAQGNLCKGCTSLREIKLWPTMNKIGANDFDGCRVLTAVNIPETVASIGSYAFRECWTLSTITIPVAVTSIGVGAFYDCFSLTAVHFLSETPPTLESDDIFAASSSLPARTIYVPTGSLEAYQAAENYPTTNITWVEE